MHAVKLAGQADTALDVQVRAPASPRARPASPVTKFAGDRPTPFRLHSNPLMVRAAAVLRLPWASATSGQRAGLSALGAKVRVSRSFQKHIGSVDPYALKIPAPKGRNAH